MIVLTLRTDKPEAEVGLYKDGAELTYEVWQAHRQLAETIHQKIEHVLSEQQLGLGNLGGIVAFQGPGSFTGLRIGITVANSLAMSLGVPIVTASGQGWINQGLQDLHDGVNEYPALPNYGSEAHVTAPKK